MNLIGQIKQASNSPTDFGGGSFLRIISVCHSERSAKHVVEVLPSGERGKTEERQRRWDLV